MAQSNPITAALQKTLGQENELRKKIMLEAKKIDKDLTESQPTNDTLEVLEAFIIKADTLYYTTKHRFEFEKGYYIAKQKVALDDIKFVTKDMSIFLETDDNKVIETREEFLDNGQYFKNSTISNLFRTYFVSFKHSEYLAKVFINAFKKAGYIIQKGFWHD